MGLFGYVILFCVFVFAILAGAYICFAIYAPKQKKKKEKRKPVKRTEPVIENKVVAENSEQGTEENETIENSTVQITVTENVIEEDEDGVSENKNEEVSLLTKIDKSASLTDTICDCEGLDEEAYIKEKLHKQDAKFVNRTKKGK